jgi:hypothetical protein
LVLLANIAISVTEPGPKCWNLVGQILTSQNLGSKHYFFHFSDFTHIKTAIFDHIWGSQNSWSWKKTNPDLFEKVDSFGLGIESRSVGFSRVKLFFAHGMVQLLQSNQFWQ